MKSHSTVRPIFWRTLKLCLLLTLLTGGLVWWKWAYLRIGAEGYLFAYPLVIMDLTRENNAITMGPQNTLHRVRQFPKPEFKDVVRPNVDTLYSVAFMDLSPGPLLFEMPANTERYEVMPLMDAWTDVFVSLGTRTTGTQGGRYLIAGPDWQGVVPPDMTLVKSPTALVWLIGRTQTQGAADYPVVHRLQDGLQLRPWAASPFKAPTEYIAAAVPSSPTSPHEPPVVHMRHMGTRELYNRFTALMLANPPKPDDMPMLSQLARIGVQPGQPVPWSALEQAAVSTGRWLADFKIAQELKKPRALVNGWSTPPRSLGHYGTDYKVRAAVAMVGLGANLPEDAMYPVAQVDAQGQALHGQYAYRLHFAAAQLPPVNAFWSVTAYGADDALIENAEHRYALGSMSPLVRNSDGSVDLWIQAQPPALAQRSNWLPIKADAPFVLNARLYWPQADALEGRWHMPALERSP
jgi:hypothetical protein